MENIWNFSKVSLIDILSKPEGIIVDLITALSRN